MAVLAECPQCHKKQATKNKLCLCGEDLDKAKKSKRVKYWINYRDPEGKQCRQSVGSFEALDGYSITDAQDALAKRTVQKKENRLFDIKAECKMTFKQLTDWYLSLEKIKVLAYYPTLKICLDTFNSEFGSWVVSQIKPMNLENYQVKRKAHGKADHTVDIEIGCAKAMINKAFDNDLVGGDTLKTFKRVKKLLKKNSNARKNIVSPEQFKKLFDALPYHTKAIFTTAYYTGMRRGEILSLTWDKVNFEKRLIELEATDTKDKEPRTIPICDELYLLLKRTPKALHDDHVFLFKGKQIKDIRTGLKRACRDAGIVYGRCYKGGFVFHDTRHTFNTYMRKAGVPESVIMGITGHSTREMFDRYDTIDAEDKRQAVTRLEVYLRNLSENVDQSVDQVQNLR